MNVIVTDDQIPVVEGILSGVDWEKIGVDKAVGAFSMKDAIEKFKEEDFDVAVCDIQMPFGNGIELAEWIKNKNSQTEIIFLTSHAEFEYAQKAIKLSCFDYLIQPVEYKELEECVRRAVERVNEGKMAKNLIESGEHWNKNKSEMENIFWKESILSASDEGLMKANAERIGIKLELSYKYLPVLLVLQSKEIKEFTSDKDNTVTEMFEETLEYITLNADFVMAEMGKDTLFIALKLINPLEYERLTSQMKLFVNINRVKFGRIFECYIGETMEITEIHKHYERLLGMKKENVMHLADVFMAENEDKKAELDEMNFGADWTLSFAKGKTDKIKEETQFLIKKLKFEKNLTHRHLFALFQKLMMSFYAASEMNSFDINELLKDEEYDKKYKKAMTPRDENDVNEYLDFICNVDISQGDEQESGDIVAEICKYIDENIGNELTREEIAGRFFLSKDYISHIFKNAMGVSLIDYINNEKTELAKHLLTTTNLPIGIVSSKVGYSNFAYFSRVFKKYTGVSPNEYRKTEK
ncbi:MAG: response regulator [Eubacterium sp.]|nr:response regulator [Eubacterium sp.]